LDIWKEAINLTKIVYEMTSNFPKEELFNLTSQIRRAAVSVASNIAEGCAKNSKKELIQHLNIALGSISELETQVIISKEIGLLKEKDFSTISSKIESIM
jgi:four helix bundle protein